ncbi:MAG: preprotein translocase subunit SecG [Armatimonadota bacterium]|nr:preprotein translocase subunit SecG [Armatimonadota bacterium]
MLLALEVTSAVTALGLIVSVVLQTSKAESFSAAMGGTDASQFRKGTREELLARLTKYFAIAWIVSVSVGTVIWYYSH